MAIDHIELRSEKTQQLLGQKPSGLMRWGTAILIFILLALVAAVCFMPYPKQLKVKAEVLQAEDSTVTLHIPIYYYYRVYLGEQVSVEFDGYPAGEFGYIHGRICDFDGGDEFTFRKATGGGTKYPVTMKTDGKGYKLRQGMKGIGTVLILDQPLLHWIIYIYYD